MAFSSCESAHNKELEIFNSTLTKEQIMLLNGFELLLDDWFTTYTDGASYNGSSMKDILMYFSKNNNISSLTVKGMTCDKFTDALKRFDENTLIPDFYLKDEENHYIKPNWDTSSFFYEAINSYARQINDTFLLQAVLSRSGINIVSPSMICSGYGGLTIGQLENPVYKRMLFADLFLLEYYSHCFSLAENKVNY